MLLISPATIWSTVVSKAYVTFIHFSYLSISLQLQTLASVMQPSREELEWPLSQMDRGVGITFSTDFNFSLAALLYKGSQTYICTYVLEYIFAKASLMSSIILISSFKELVVLLHMCSSQYIYTTSKSCKASHTFCVPS